MQCAQRRTNTTVLISGAGIAGPTLAHWLARYGFRPTVVELAPAPRPGGQAVDFRGAAHLTVLRRTGVLEELRRLQTGGAAMRFVDEAGRQLLTLPRDFAGGELEVLRGDLAQVLYAHSRAETEYLFGETLTALEQTATGVRATFREAPAREFDLVIGADGLHSRTRRLAFGPEEEYVSHLGYYAAIWTLPNYRRSEPGWECHNTPGRFASLSAESAPSDRARASLVFAAPELAYDRHDPEAQKALLRREFADMGWEAPRLLDSLADAEDLYLDAIARSDVPSWSHGRIALLGDAACGATLGGMGTGAAVVGAYVLAGELARADGDHRLAFPAYERRLRRYAATCQRSGDRSGRFLAPPTARALRRRNRWLGNRLVLQGMLALGKHVAGLELPDYAAHEPGVQRTPGPAQA